jgi:hypothetical protein
MRGRAAKGKGGATRAYSAISGRACRAINSMKADRVSLRRFASASIAARVAKRLVIGLSQVCDGGTPRFLGHRRLIADYATIFWDTYFPLCGRDDCTISKIALRSMFSKGHVCGGGVHSESAPS